MNKRTFINDSVYSLQGDFKTQSRFARLSEIRLIHQEKLDKQTKENVADSPEIKRGDRVVLVDDKGNRYGTVKNLWKYCSQPHIFADVEMVSCFN